MSLTCSDLTKLSILQIAFLDYVRFLIGSMWGACTPATFEARRGDINQGMHKRDAAHQFAMVTRAAQLLGGRYSRVVPFDAAQTALWDSLPPALRIAAAGVHAAEQAGAVVRSYFGVTQGATVRITRFVSLATLAHVFGWHARVKLLCRMCRRGYRHRSHQPVARHHQRYPFGVLEQYRRTRQLCAAENGQAARDRVAGGCAEELDAKLKGVDDPQTAADLAAEAVLLSELQRPFPRMHVVGEEGVSPGALLPSLIGGAPCYAHVLTVLADALNRGAVPDAVERARDEDVTVWVDPLDGTRELLMDNCPAVTVLVGVAVSGVPVFGCIHQVRLPASALMPGLGLRLQGCSEACSWALKGTLKVGMCGQSPLLTAAGSVVETASMPPETPLQGLWGAQWALSRWRPSPWVRAAASRACKAWCGRPRQASKRPCDSTHIHSRIQSS